MRIVKILIAVVVVVVVAGWALINVRLSQDFLFQKMVEIGMSRSANQSDFDGLKVFMCGTASAMPSLKQAQACVAVFVGKQIYLVDAGMGSSRAMTAERIPLAGLQAILLTHYHSDHISGIGDFNLASWVNGRQQQLKIIGPAGVHKIVSGFNEMYALDRTYRVRHHGADLVPPKLGVLSARQIRPGVIVDNGGLKITAFEVNHAPITPAMGYRFDYRGRSVVISGDSVVSDTLETASMNADLLLHDALSLPLVQTLERAANNIKNKRLATVLSDIQNYHADTLSLLPLAKRAKVQQLALYHLVPAPDNIIMEKIFRRDLPSDVVITKDGMWFELPAKSSVINIR